MVVSDGNAYNLLCCGVSVAVSLPASFALSFRSSSVELLPLPTATEALAGKETWPKADPKTIGGGLDPAAAGGESGGLAMPTPDPVGLGIRPDDCQLGFGG